MPSSADLLLAGIPPEVNGPDLLRWWPFIALPTLYIVFGLVVGYYVPRAFGMSKTDSRFISVCSAFCNTVSVPLSLAESVVAEVDFVTPDGDSHEAVLARATAYALIFNTVNNLIRWSIGYEMLRPVPGELRANGRAEGALAEKLLPDDDADLADLERDSEHTQELSRAQFVQTPDAALDELNAVKRQHRMLSESGIVAETDVPLLRSAAHSIRDPTVMKDLSPPSSSTSSSESSCSPSKVSRFPNFSDQSSPPPTVMQNPVRARASIQYEDGGAIPHMEAGADTLSNSNRDSDSDGSRGTISYRHRQQAYAATPAETATLQTQKAEPVWTRLKRALNAPTYSVIAAIVIGLVSPIRDFIYATNGRSSDDVPLGFLSSAVSDIGDMAIPFSVLLLGAKMSRPKIRGDGVLSLVAFISIFRLVLIPAFGLALVYIAELGNLLLDDPIFRLMLLIQNSTPTANNIIIMCTLHRQYEKEMGTVIFFGYVFSVFTVTGWVSAFLVFEQRNFPS